MQRKKLNKDQDAQGPDRQRVPRYLYHNVRREQDVGLNQNTSQISNKHIHQAKKIWLEKFGLIILAIAIIVSLVSVLYLSPNSVVILLSQPSKYSIYSRYESAVQTTANKLLSNSILNSNKITLNTKKIVSKLEADYPMYSAISITVPLIDHHAVIYLTPAKPSIEFITSSGQYLLNQNGQVMTEGADIKDFSTLNLPKVQYLANQSSSIGSQELTSQEIQFIEVIEYELLINGDKVTLINLPPGTYELNVYISGVTYYIKFNLENNDPRQQVGSFLATQHYLKANNITPTKYVDVMTDGRVYYQ